MVSTLCHHERAIQQVFKVLSIKSFAINKTEKIVWPRNPHLWFDPLYKYYGVLKHITFNTTDSL